MKTFCMKKLLKFLIFQKLETIEFESIRKKTFSFSSSCEVGMDYNKNFLRLINSTLHGEMNLTKYKVTASQGQERVQVHAHR